MVDPRIPVLRRIIGEIQDGARHPGPPYVEPSPARILELLDDATSPADELTRLQAANQELLLVNRALTVERDQLLDERSATRAWLGEKLVKDSPLAPPQSGPMTNEQMAYELVKRYPDKKIMAIKELRAYSAGVRDPNTGAWTRPDDVLGLKEAKDMIDLAYAGRL